MPALNRTVSWLLCSTMSLQKPALSSVFWKKTAAPAAEEAGDSKEAELVEMLIAMRQDARKNKNYALADELRNKLNEIGIVLQDTPQGVKWSKQ
mgnify:CR=1 FL=1